MSYEKSDYILNEYKSCFSEIMRVFIYLFARRKYGEQLTLKRGRYRRHLITEFITALDTLQFFNLATAVHFRHTSTEQERRQLHDFITKDAAAWRGDQSLVDHYY